MRWVLVTVPSRTDTESGNPQCLSPGSCQPLSQLFGRVAHQDSPSLGCPLYTTRCACIKMIRGFLQSLYMFWYYGHGQWWIPGTGVKRLLVTYFNFYDALSILLKAAFHTS